MAETTITLIEGDGASSLPPTGVEKSDKGTTQVVPADSQSQQVSEQAQARIAELERLSARHREQLAGWDKHSQQLVAERNALAERLARLEGRLEAQPKPDEPRFTPGKMKSAMKKWLDGDDSELDQVEQALIKSFGPPAQSEPQFKPDDFKRIVREELIELGTKSNMQSIVGTRHPDLADPQSQLSQSVWDGYDTFVADPANALMFAKDPRFEVPMTGPDGAQRMVDARVVDRLAADIRLRTGIQEGRRQESRAAQVGSVQTSTGTNRSTQRAVEAIELLTEGERRLLSDPKVRKGWPKMPADPKLAAKYFFDGLSADERAKRVQAYRNG